MKKYIITISREFGCGARPIGQELSKRLGIKFYDKELIDLAAERAGVSPGLFQDTEIDYGEDQVKKLLKEFVYGSTTLFYSDAAINLQAEVIRELAEGESAIFFGRCSNYLLRERSDVLNFFLYAPLQERIIHISKKYNLTAKNAENLISKVDRQRHNYFKYVTGENRGDRNNNQVMIDVSCFGETKTVELMEDAIAKKFGSDVVKED